MPESRRPKTPDEIAVLGELIDLGDALKAMERRFVDDVIGRPITDTEALDIANLLARYASRTKDPG